MSDPVPGLRGVPTALSMREKDGPQLLSPLASFADPAFAGGVLWVTGLLAEDRVDVRDEGGGVGRIGRAGGDVTYGGVVIGAAAGGAGQDFSVALNAQATPEAVQALLRALVYDNVSDAPTPTRRLRIDLDDGVADAAFVRLAGAGNPLADVSHSMPAPTFADLDADGDLDLVVSEYMNSRPVMYRNEGGAFRAVQADADPFRELQLSVGNTMTHVAAFLDIDGDGDLDMAVGDQNDELDLVENRGGVFHEWTGRTDWTDLDDWGGRLPERVAPTAADVDGDGVPDVAFAASKLNSGTGEEESVVVLTQRNGSDFRFVAEIVLPVQHHIGVGFGDIDGDGDADMILGGQAGRLDAFRNDGGFSFTPLTGDANPFAGVDLGVFTRPTFADVTGDGRADLITGHNDNIAVFESRLGTIEVRVAEASLRLEGGDGDDRLVGGADDDRLRGFGGSDELVGGGDADLLDGGAGADTLDGGAGDDVLAGGAGADRLDGGAGFDVASYADAAAGVTVNLLNARANRGDASGDRLTGVEGVTGSGFADLIVAGAATRRVEAGAGDDTVKLVAAPDLVDGGAGVDTLSVERGAALTLTDATMRGVEHVRVVRGSVDLSGVTGGVLSIRLVTPAGGRATAVGTAEDDVIRGGAGDDAVAGAGGADRLYGGAGADRFFYRSLSDLGPAAAPAGRETIADFSAADGDRIDFSAIDADGDAANGRQALRFIGAAAFAPGSGQAALRVATGRREVDFVQIDADGDGRADFVFTVFSDQPLTASGFIL